MRTLTKTSTLVENNIIHVDAAIAPINIDLILDQDMIIGHDLVRKFPSQFAKGELLEKLQSIHADISPESVPALCECRSTNNHRKIICDHPLWQQWQDALTDIPHITKNRSFIESQKWHHDERKQTHELSSLESFLGALSIRRPSGKVSKHYRKRWAKRGDDSIPCSKFTEVQLDQLNELY